MTETQKMLPIQFLIKRPESPSRRTGVALLIAIVLIIASIPFILVYTSPNHFNICGGGGAGHSSLVGPCDDFQSLKGDSNIVVLGTFAKINSTWKFGGFFYPIVQVNVTSYLKGSGPSVIYVENAPIEPTRPIEGLPALGRESVLFLVRVKPCPPSPPAPCPEPPPPFNTISYVPTGGAQGEFPVLNGLVYGFKTLDPKEAYWMKVDANGEPLAQFMTKVLNV